MAGPSGNLNGSTNGGSRDEPRFINVIVELKDEFLETDETKTRSVMEAQHKARIGNLFWALVAKKLVDEEWDLDSPMTGHSMLQEPTTNWSGQVVKVSNLQTNSSPVLHDA